jgi:hypothetical protein
MLRLNALGLSLGALLTLGGCVGEIGDGDDPAGGPGSAEGVNVAAAPIRRMTPVQYQNSVRDLLGDAELEVDLDADSGEAFSYLGAQKLNAAVEGIMGREAEWKSPIFPCDISGAEDAACVDAFIETFGRRAFRRPLFNEEIDWLKGIYGSARAEQSFHDAMLVVLSVMLQSPQFLYFLELGTEGTKGLPAGVVALSGFERATRLSYFLTNSTPDDELLEAAELGALDTREGVRDQAERILGSDRGKQLVAGFFSDMLELEGTTMHSSLDDVTKDGELYPLDSPALRTAMKAEVAALVERVVFEDRKGLRELFLSNDAYVDADLAAVYGVDPPTGGTGWVELPAERAGLLTRSAFLTLYSRGDVKSPIRRGAFLLKNVLCYELGDPPPDANDVVVTGGTVEENGENVRRTIREDVEAKTTGEGCNGCHHLINPAGFAFESFDGLGQLVTEELGEDEDGSYSLPIDDSGVLPKFDDDGGIDGEVPVIGAVEMSQAVAASPALAACVAEKWFGVALGRKAAEEDARSVDRIKRAIDDDAPLFDVVLEAASSDAFLYLRKESAQ